MLRERGKVRVKLPKLPTEKFSGDTKQHRNFKDAFEIAVNESNKLTGVEKFIYQRNFLTRDALRLQTSDNYRVALEFLVGRFQREKLIIASPSKICA